MSILVYKDTKMVGVSAATLLAAHLLASPKCVIGVDYHETLLPVFDSLSTMTENGLIAWNDAQVYQLFEFLPDESGEQRIANLLGKALFAKTDICEKQYCVPFSSEMPYEETARQFERSVLNDGGLDVALIAVRQDGSLLMNRSIESDSETHMERIDDDGFITVGLNILMQTKHPIIIASGKSSSAAVRTMLHGNLRESPLAALKLHPGATFIMDEEAAEMLL